MKKILYLLFFLFLITFTFAQNISEIKNPTANSFQMIVVITDNWKSNSGFLQLFRRNKLDDNWENFSISFEIAIGKNGLAWGYGLHGNKLSNFDVKKEGDAKSPAGVFSLSAVFGYAKPEEMNFIKMPYIYSHSKCFCIDDVNSQFYNLIIDSNFVNNSDWTSKEKMKLKNDLYKYGIVIDNNSSPRVKGNGSCIFFHIWDEKDKPTVGCTVMSEKNILEIIKWLDKSKNPIVVQLPKEEYLKLKNQWNLPSIQ